jgi:hypothetical protein
VTRRKKAQTAKWEDVPDDDSDAYSSAASAASGEV